MISSGIAAAIVALLVAPSLAGSAETCAADGSCAAPTAGMSLIQNPSHRAKQLLKTVVHDADIAEHEVTSPEEAIAAKGTSMMQNDKSMTSRKALGSLGLVEEDEGVHDDELLKNEEDELMEESHEDEAEHHAAEALQAKEEGRHEDYEYHTGEAEHHTAEALLQAKRAGHADTGETHEDMAKHHAEEAKIAKEDGRHEDAQHHEDEAEHFAAEALGAHEEQPVDDLEKIAAEHPGDDEDVRPLLHHSNDEPDAKPADLKQNMHDGDDEHDEAELEGGQENMDEDQQDVPEGVPENGLEDGSAE